MTARYELDVPMHGGIRELAAAEEDGSLCYSLQREMTDVAVVARFTIEGEPASKARARWSPKTKRHYTPEGTRTAEECVGWAFKKAAPGHLPTSDECYGVYAGFFCGTGQRRDVDNMLKLVLDGLNKIAWDDDSQVTEISGKLLRHQSGPRVEVVVYRTMRQLRPTRSCEHCGNPFAAYPSQQQGKRVRRFCGRDCGNAWRRAKNRKECQHCGKEFQSAREAMYCSKTCAYAAKNRELTCVHCGNNFTRARSLAANAVHTCSPECRAAYWRAHRTNAAKGVCGDCGGPTSKKTYRRCQACATQAQTS
jgi:hypothetical protein